jgi:hypothetical protein
MESREGERLGIFQAIPKVMADLGPIAKDQVNQQQGFKFRGIDQVYNELNGHMARHGIFSNPIVLERTCTERTSSKGNVLYHVLLKVLYRFFHSDGSSIDVMLYGEAMDSGDKATNKAMAIAHKYALLQLFCIPTEEDKDPDRMTHETTTQKQKLVNDVFDLLSALTQNYKDKNYLRLLLDDFGIATSQEIYETDEAMLLMWKSALEGIKARKIKENSEGH